MEYKIKLINAYKEEITEVSKRYDLFKHINEIFRGADWTMANWTYNKNPRRHFTELISLIYSLQYGELSQHGIKITSVIDNKNFSFKINEEKLTKNLIEYLKGFINEETKLFYYNNLIIEEEKEKEDEEETLYIKLKTNESIDTKLTEGQKNFLNNYGNNNKSKEGIDRCKNFFSKESLKKIIEFEKKQPKLPKNKNQLIGYYANMLFDQYKYDVFKYEYEYESLDNDLEILEEIKNINKNTSYSISKYKQYIFIYEILYILKIIPYKETVRNNSDKHKFIKTCIQSYNKSRYTPNTFMHSSPTEDNSTVSSPTLAETSTTTDSTPRRACGCSSAGSTSRSASTTF